MTDDDTRIKLAEFTAKVTEWMVSTTEYRKALCSKLDIITDRLNKLPCDRRVGFYESVSMQMKFIWGVMVILVGAIIAEWVKR